MLKYYVKRSKWWNQFSLILNLLFNNINNGNIFIL